MYVHHGIHELIFNFVGTLEASQVGVKSALPHLQKYVFFKWCILYCENVLQSVMQGICRSLSPEGLALWTLSDRHDTVFLNERMLMWWRSRQTDLVSVLLLVNRTPPSTKPAGVCRICSRKTWESNLSSGQCSSLFSHLLIEWRCQTGRDIKVRLKWFEVLCAGAFKNTQTSES